MKRALLITVLSALGVYVCDLLLARYRIAKGNAFGTVKVERYYAVRRKDGKTEYMFDQPETQQCVHSLFPHSGYVPCWYANRRRVKRISA